MEHFNKLTPGEDERLAWLIEECSEVIKAATKILRHGYESYNPDDPNHPGNRKELEIELIDLFSSVGLMINNGDIDPNTLETFVKGREIKFGMRRPVRNKYLHHQGN